MSHSHCWHSVGPGDVLVCCRMLQSKGVPCGAVLVSPNVGHEEKTHGGVYASILRRLAVKHLSDALGPVAPPG